MPTEVSPRQLGRAVDAGFKRLRNFRDARLMFIRQFSGQYYDQDHGVMLAEPLNLIFNAIRILVPQLVMNFPKYHVQSNFVAFKDYGDMLGLALDQNSIHLDVRTIYRRMIVDSLFAIGILKTGLTNKNEVLGFDEFDGIDTGEVYTANVSFDNFVYDPSTRGDIKNAAFMGDRIAVPRAELLESGLYRNDLISRLPTMSKHRTNTQQRSRASDLSMRSNIPGDGSEWLDEVEVIELWVPRANAIVTLPGDPQTQFDDYLRITDYEGPREGPYTLLSFSPPVPDNPQPIAMVGIWYDIHVMANKMVKKVMEQAQRQKTIVGYRRSAADDANEAKKASDGEAVAMDDPDGLKVMNFGGQEKSNEVHISQLQQWFNLMADNPQGVGGVNISANSATEANILQGNANVLLEDDRDAVYIAAAAEGRNRAWYFHSDPLIDIPLIRRQPTMTPDGIQTVDVQLFLTPEVRRGDFLDWMFTVEPESMGRVDAALRLAQATDFAVKIMPAALQVAQIAGMMGIPFNVQVFIENMARDRGIKWMSEVWFDPMFQQKQAFIMLQAGPSFQGSQGQPVGAKPPNMLLELLQNGQPANIPKTRNSQEQFNFDVQGGANIGQGQLPVRQGQI